MPNSAHALHRLRPSRIAPLTMTTGSRSPCSRISSTSATNSGPRINGNSSAAGCTGGIFTSCPSCFTLAFTFSTPMLKGHALGRLVPDARAITDKTPAPNEPVPNGPCPVRRRVCDLRNSNRYAPEQASEAIRPPSQDTIFGSPFPSSRHTSFTTRPYSLEPPHIHHSRIPRTSWRRRSAQWAT
jgi:hypothetical protein